MSATNLRVLVVDDNHDGANALGLLAEELGHKVHVTYGGVSALEAALVFQPDLMLIDLAMPDLDGCSLVRRIQNVPAMKQIKLVAITGHADQGHKTLALKAGFDAVLFKPVTLSQIKSTLASVIPVHAPSLANTEWQRLDLRPGVEPAGLLPVDEARRIRNARESKKLSERESRGAISACFVQFQSDYLGWRSERIHVHFVENLLIIRSCGGLTLAEGHLAQASSPLKGRELIKQFRKQLLEAARPILESMVHEVTAVKPQGMHHDVSTVTGEELIVFTLKRAPHFEFD